MSFSLLLLLGTTDKNVSFFFIDSHQVFIHVVEFPVKHFSSLFESVLMKK